MSNRVRAWYNYEADSGSQEVRAIITEIMYKKKCRMKWKSSLATIAWNALAQLPVNAISITFQLLFFFSQLFVSAWRQLFSWTSHEKTKIRFTLAKSRDHRRWCRRCHCRVLDSIHCLHLITAFQMTAIGKEKICKLCWGC